MWTTLSSFYNSKEWREFRQSIIHKRTNPVDGVLYDEITGNPLVKAYDIVLHHKTPLTMQNVNDYSVSLNPDNVIVISQETHNKEHARFGHIAERKVYYVYGSPCSGKTTFVNTIKGNSDLVVDMDNIWQCITGGERYEKPNALKQNAFGLRDCLYDMVKRRVGKWERCFVITGGAVGSARRREIEELSAEGIFINESKETCLNRLLLRCGANKAQYEEWKKYIERWFDDYTE